MVLAAQSTTSPKVELATLVHSEQAVDIPPHQLRKHEKRGEIAVPQHDLAGFQAIQQSAEESRFPCVLPLVRTKRQVANYPGGQ